jgi:hypothetical protein
MPPARTETLTRSKVTAPTHRRGAGPSTRGAVRNHRRDTGAQAGRSPAVVRAYARRAQRMGAPRGGSDHADSGRTPFVMLVMVALAVALVATLWLSTAATAGSYHLQSARKDARNLTERSESLGREVATLETAPELARRARELGMVPAGDAARLVQRPDGSVFLIGQPRRATATAPAPPVPPAQPPPAQPAPPVAASASAPLAAAPAPPVALPSPPATAQ